MAKKIKIKTHSGAKKRFNISKNGKVKYQKTNRPLPALMFYFFSYELLMHL